MSSLIGNNPDQLPTNGDLGGMAFQDPKAVNITGGVIDVDSLKVSGGSVALASALAALELIVDGKQDAITIGSWIPAWSFSGGGSVTPNGVAGGMPYFRIGPFVIANFYAATGALSSPTGDVRISLPVAATVSQGPNYEGAGAIVSANWASNAPTIAKVVYNTSYAELFYATATGAAKVQASSMNSGSYQNVIQGTLIYLAAALP